jgi:hypothetical protein
MESSTFGLQVADAGGDLPKEWQALIASTTSMLGALLSRMRTTAVTQRQRVLGPQQPSRDPTGTQADHTRGSAKGLGTPWPPCCRTWV